MDLTSRLLRWGAARPHVLVLPALGGTAARLAVEAELARRGWPAADSPADADLLVVAGEPGPALGAVVDAVAGAMAAPSQVVRAGRPAAVATALDAGAAALADPLRQRAPRPRGRVGGPDPDQPGGLPMPDLAADDRDGLALDVLHVALGPALPDWPAGLVVRVELHGDLVTAAEAELLDAAGPAAGSFWSVEPGTAGPAAERRTAARHLDGLGRFLAVAGWTDPAARARWARDELLDGRDEAVPRALRLLDRVGRARLLRRMVRGLGAGGPDVLSLLDGRLAAAGAALTGDGGGQPSAGRGPAVEPEPDRIAARLVGLDLAAARLLLAALDPDTEAIAAGAHRG